LENDRQPLFLAWHAGADVESAPVDFMEENAPAFFQINLLKFLFPCVKLKVIIESEINFLEA